MSLVWRGWVFALIWVGWCVLAWGAQEEVYRFLVLSDPQYRVARAGDPAGLVVNGYRWSSATWAGLPGVAEKLGARFVFVPGDIFEYKEGDGATVAGLWDHWDQYTRRFGAAGARARIEWITGGHEYWDGGKDYDHAAKDVFLKRYPEKVRYAVRDGENLFVLFDDIHDPWYLEPNGIGWLKKTLEEAEGKQKRIFFFGHVPPRSTAAWWPDGSGVKVDGARSQMAALLTKHRVTAAFFGHEHFPSYLGDAGGFPMIVVAQAMPVLVEIRGDVVSYRWLKAPLAEDPLAQMSEVVRDEPVKKVWVAAIPPGRKLAEAAEARGRIDPERPVRLDDGSEVGFAEVAVGVEGVALSAVPGARAGGQVVVIAEVKKENSWAQHFRVRSGAAGEVYFNGQALGRIMGDAGRWEVWHVRARGSERPRVTLVLEVEDVGARFVVVPHVGP